MLAHIVRHVLERQDLRASNLDIHGWRTTTRISHRRPDLQGQRSIVARSCDQSEPSWPNAVHVSLEAGGGIPCRPNPAAILLVGIAILLARYTMYYTFTFCVLSK